MVPGTMPASYAPSMLTARGCCSCSPSMQTSSGSGSVWGQSLVSAPVRKTPAQPMRSEGGRPPSNGSEGRGYAGRGAPGRGAAGRSGRGLGRGPGRGEGAWRGAAGRGIAGRSGRGPGRGTSSSEGPDTRDKFMRDAPGRIPDVLWPTAQFTKNAVQLTMEWLQKNKPESFPPTFIENEVSCTCSFLTQLQSNLIGPIKHVQLRVLQ
jgi:hypothetical protein